MRPPLPKSSFCNIRLSHTLMCYSHLPFFGHPKSSFSFSSSSVPSRVKHISSAKVILFRPFGQATLDLIVFIPKAHDHPRRRHTRMQAILYLSLVLSGPPIGPEVSSDRAISRSQALPKHSMYVIDAYIDPHNHPWPDRQSHVPLVVSGLGKLKLCRRSKVYSWTH